jgi:excisionase family DNA binding protein
MTTTATRESEWVSIADAAEQLGVHPRTLRRYIRDEKLAVLRLSPQVVRVRPEDIEAFLEQNMKITTGTGTCYVPRLNPAEVAPSNSKPKAAKPARFTP